MAITSLLTVAEFKLRSIMPPADVDGLETSRPGFLLKRLTAHSSRILARLGKRYAVPFVGGTPDVVLQWLADLVTLEAYQARGFNPGSAQDQTIVDAAKQAEADLKEASDSKDGLFDLPLREGAADAASGVVFGGPEGYAESSPYAWTDVQNVDGHADDARGRGR